MKLRALIVVHVAVEFDADTMPTAEQVAAHIDGTGGTGLGIDWGDNREVTNALMSVGADSLEVMDVEEVE